VGWCIAWVFSAALYWWLIDTRQSPELIAGAVAATIAAIGSELARSQGLTEERIRAGWLLRVHRPLLKVPKDVVTVSVVALRQLRHPRKSVGAFRAFPFRSTEQQELEYGRHAMAETFGSFAPNTIIVGVDSERQMILGHQLGPGGGRESIDVLELG
jgi:hypothetical protein